jgi:hypothetical protein
MTCPTCGKPVDSLRAPAVRVTAGKVVPYCSKECAAAAESKPVQMPNAAPVETKPATKAQPKKKTPPAGVPKSPDELDSGPVIQIVHEPGSGVVTSAADARKERARSNPRAEADGAIQIADTGHIDDFVSYDEPTRSRVTLIVLVLVLVVAAGGAAAYYLGAFDKYLGKSSVAAVPKTVEMPKPELVAIDAPPPLTPEIALERAKTVLREQMKSNSLRVQRVAASALARTKDREAIELLAKQLGDEKTLNAKLELAYALARGDDKRGVDALLAAASGERESRHMAGQKLAALGNKAAVHALVGSLEYSQFRLSVAEQLARFAEPRALKVLDEVRADDKATADDKARATIALGHAGRTDVAPALRELLADGRNNLFAAGALADLHDEAARPVLVKQLGIAALRVQAARWLRRLDPAGHSETGQLEPLVDELDNKRDTEQVQIAEAILLLAGPASWSESE